MNGIQPWWVLRVLPQKEIETEKLIRRLGYEAMSPYVEGRRRVHKTPRPWKYPLFSGYVFANWPNWREGWNKITDKDRGIAWVYDFLRPSWQSAEPSVLKPADVAYLKSIADGRYQPGEPAPRLRIGDYVLIPDGSFQGCIGTVKEISGKTATVEVPEVKMTSNIKIRLAKLEKCE